MRGRPPSLSEFRGMLKLLESAPIKKIGRRWMPFWINIDITPAKQGIRDFW